MSASPLQNKNIIVSPKMVSKPSKKDVQSSQDDVLPGHLMKVDVSLKNLSDSRMFWSSLPSNIHCLGKVGERVDVFVCCSCMCCAVLMLMRGVSFAGSYGS